MSTTTVEAPARGQGAIARPGLGRLTVVELRKMADTRAGFWLLLSTAGLTLLALLVAALTGSGEDRTLLNFLSISTFPGMLLLPVVGILLVTSEWSQRTAMITFALIPQRSRVLAAKLIAGLALVLITLAICLVAALIATAVAGGGTDDTWSLSLGMVVQSAVSISLPMLTGLAFGAVLLASAPAIVLYFILPTAWSALGTIHKLEGAARWLDQARTTEPLLEHHLDATQWARLGTSVALWTLLPILIGLWRIARADVR
jgi:hypothetical protein